eukprot:791928_1
MIIWINQSANGITLLRQRCNLTRVRSYDDLQTQIRAMLATKEALNAAKEKREYLRLTALQTTAEDDDEEKQSREDEKKKKLEDILRRKDEAIASNNNKEWCLLYAIKDEANDKEWDVRVGDDYSLQTLSEEQGIDEAFICGIDEDISIAEMRGIPHQTHESDARSRGVITIPTQTLESEIGTQIGVQSNGSTDIINANLRPDLYTQSNGYTGAINANLRLDSNNNQMQMQEQPQRGILDVMISTKK